MAAEFVEGGVQEACDDACSICLEPFSTADPASITNCNHAYHLQCILEWVQRSSDCPMCWQPLIMKDDAGQELLSSVEHERSLCFSQIQASYIPSFRSDDHEVDHYASFEERLMQHLAAATAGQAHIQGRQEHFLLRPTSSGGNPHQFLFFQPSPSTVSGSDNLDSSTSNNIAFSVHPEVTEQDRSVTEDVQVVHGAIKPGIVTTAISSDHASASQAHDSRPGNATQGASTSDCQSFSEAVKSRFAAVSSKYKDVLTKTSRMLREKMRSPGVVNMDTRGIRSRDVSTGVMQALGQISLESAGQRKDMDGTAHARIADKKKVGGGSLDEDKPANSIF